ncbi:MAG: hypothetical protein K6E51_02670 [Treponema sp.]|nr:hypothetical protein [Treponema sp.]
MSQMLSTLLTGKFRADSERQFVGTSTTIKFNGFLFQLEFTQPDDYKEEQLVQILKAIQFNHAIRFGTSNGGNLAVISNLNARAVFLKGDELAGMSVKSVKVRAGRVTKLCAYLPIGYFSLGSRDALESQIQFIGAYPENITSGITFKVSGVYKHEAVSVLTVYQLCKATGGDQPYKNVTEIDFIGDSKSRPNVTITDDIGSQSVDIDDAIALSNATQRFETFTEFGELYKDPYNMGQNVTFNCPAVASDDADLLVVGLAYYPDLLSQQAQETTAQKQSLLSKIAVNDQQKYQYLDALGYTK